MTELMGKRAHAADAVCVAHHNEGKRILWDARREGALPLACIGRPVHPAVLQAALAYHADIFLPHGRQTFADPVHGLFKGYLVFFGGERRPDIVGMKRLYPQDFAAQLPVAVPQRQFFLENIQQVIKHFHRDIAIEQGRFQRRLKITRPHVKDILLDGGGQVAGQRVLMLQIFVIVVFPGGSPRPPVCASQDGAVGTLGNLDLFIPVVTRWFEFEIGICQQRGRAACAGEGIAQHAQQLLYFFAADVGLLAEEIGEIMLVQFHAWIACQPFTKFFLTNVQ